MLHVQKLCKQRTDSGGALSVDATTFYLGDRTRETTMTLKV